MAVDMIDRPGVGQVRVERGFGVITKLEAKGDRNAQVTIKADHLQDPVTGWVDRLDRSVYDPVELLWREQRRCSYIVETRAKQPTDKPLRELSPREKIREVIEVRPVTVDGGTQPGADAVDRPAIKCPVEECQVGPFADRAELNAHLEETHRPPDEPAGDEAPTPTPPESADTAPAGPPAPAARGGRRGPRIEEAKPWEAYNSDGSLNLGSYAVTASLGYTELAYDLALAKARTDLAVAGGTLVAPSWPAVKALARALLTAADRAQKRNRSDGNVDRMDNSHTRARGAVRAALDAYPVPWGATAEEREAWVETLAETAAELIGIAVALVDHQDGRL